MSVHEIRQRDKIVAIYDVLKFLIPGSSTDKVKKRLEKAGTDFPQQYHAIKQRMTNIRGFGRGVGTPAIHIDHLEELLSLLPSLPKATAAQLVATLKEHVEMGTRVIQITAHKQYLPAGHAAAQAAAMNHLQHTLGAAGQGPPHAAQNGASLPLHNHNGMMPAAYPLPMQSSLGSSCQLPLTSADVRKRKAPEPSTDFASLWQRAHQLVAAVESSTAELKHILGILGPHYNELLQHHHRQAAAAAAAATAPGMVQQPMHGHDQMVGLPNLPPAPPASVASPTQMHTAPQPHHASPVGQQLQLHAPPNAMPRRLSPVGMKL